MFKSIVGVTVLLLLLISPCVAATFDITATWGETWVSWEWEVPPSMIDNGTVLNIAVDGNVVRSDLLNSSLVIPIDYYLTGVNANEEHTVRVWAVKGAVILGDDTNTVSTSQSSFYNYTIFLLAVLILVISIFTRVKIVGIIMSVVTIVLFLFMSTTTAVSNPPFSTINLIFAVTGGFVAIYILYSMWMKYTMWESD